MIYIVLDKRNKYIFSIFKMSITRIIRKDSINTYFPSTIKINCGETLVLSGHYMNPELCKTYELELEKESYSSILENINPHKKSCKFHINLCDSYNKSFILGFLEYLESYPYISGLTIYESSNDIMIFEQICKLMIQNRRIISFSIRELSNEVESIFFEIISRTNIQYLTFTYPTDHQIHLLTKVVARSSLKSINLLHSVLSIENIESLVKHLEIGSDLCNFSCDFSRSFEKDKDGKLSYIISENNPLMQSLNRLIHNQAVLKNIGWTIYFHNRCNPNQKKAIFTMMCLYTFVFPWNMLPREIMHMIFKFYCA